MKKGLSIVLVFAMMITAIFAVTPASALDTNKQLRGVAVTVTFDANGGDAASVPAPQNYEAGQLVIIPRTIPTRSGFAFYGWGSSSSTASRLCYAGDYRTFEEDTTYYAVWKETVPTNNGGFTMNMYDYGDDPLFIHSQAQPTMKYNIGANGYPDGASTAFSPELIFKTNTGTFLMKDEETGNYFFNTNYYALYDNASNSFLVSHIENPGPLGEQFKPTHKFYFGFDLAADFTMPVDGQTGRGDMKFEFRGDDLIYVYIDDVLVLIGGSPFDYLSGRQDGNQAHTSINFATGEVYSVNNGDNISYPGASATTIYDRFATAYREANPSKTEPEVAAYLATKFVQNDNGQYVFKNNTDHKFKMFYSEAKGQISTCNLNFNLDVIPPERKIKFWDDATLLQQETVADGVTSYTLTSAPITTPEAGVTIENGIPVKEGYVFAGWYTSAASAVLRTSADAYPQHFTLEDYYVGGCVNLYAGWVAEGTPAKAAADRNTYSNGNSVLDGYSLEGIQVREANLFDPYTTQYNKVYDGLRFITIYSNTMMTQLQAVSGAKTVQYGYAAGLKAQMSIAGTDHLTVNTTGAHNVDCTKSVADQNHRYFTDYRLSTVVIKYDASGSVAEYNAKKLQDVVARAYLRYDDANGFDRYAYDTYSGTAWADGCVTNMNAALNAMEPFISK